MDVRAEITDLAIRQLVDRFYAKVRADELIGPLFNRAIADWDHHLAKLADFWSSIIHTSGRYKGNPMIAHLKHVAAIAPGMFDRWLELWMETTEESLSPEAAALFQAKARRIAESLQLGLKLHGGGLDAIRARPAPPPESPVHGNVLGSVPLQEPGPGEDDALRPYKVTPVFDAGSLPEGLRRVHSTKAGVWGKIQVLEGVLRLRLLDSDEEVLLTPERPGVVQPQQPHLVTPEGKMRMRIEFYDRHPAV